MRGPVMFLLGAVIAVVAAVTVVWPACEERTTLRRSLLDAASTEPTPHTDTWRLATATRDLQGALGQAAKDPEGAVRRIALETAPDATVHWDAGSLLVTLPWEKVPAMLAGISGPGAPPFIRVTAGPANEGENNGKSCLLTLLPEDTTPR